MVESAAALIGANGVSATSFSAVVEESGAPRGSIYHHFPGGKLELASDAVEWRFQQVLGLQTSCPGPTPVEVLEWFVDMWRQVVVATGGAAGCVVAGVTIDSTPGDPLLDVAQDTFRRWIETLAGQLEAAGLPPERSLAVATTALAAMEGALILCRAEGSVAPLEVVSAQLLGLLG
jgi:AcrR family transcriptional regulator